MKNFKGFAFGLVLGLGLAISSLGFAQTVTQTDQKKEPHSCSLMSAGSSGCCCKGDSCSMKEHANKDHMKTHAAAGGHCCCCGAESCDMKMTHEMKDKPKG